ncbi:MAG: hypothetical protein R3E08_04130 [Thiotrichaceae bacterium]
MPQPDFHRFTTTAFAQSDIMAQYSLTPVPLLCASALFVVSLTRIIYSKILARLLTTLGDCCNFIHHCDRGVALEGLPMMIAMVLALNMCYCKNVASANYWVLKLPQFDRTFSDKTGTLTQRCLDRAQFRHRRCATIPKLTDILSKITGSSRIFPTL